MGIRPRASGEQIIIRDVRDELTDDLTATAGEVGQPIGEALDEIYATAQSANTSAGELAARIARLEGRDVVVKDEAGRLQAADPAEPDDVATKRYVDGQVRTAGQVQSAVLTTGERTGAWAKWKPDTCPPWLGIGSNSLTLPSGHWRVEVVQGQVVIYENGALRAKAPTGWVGVVLGSGQIYDGAGGAMVIITRLY
ncbi:hypothetical protein [Corynebacterium wankanglinii]|uniref:Uncharacterized protein n=1 Tax=Corynebacterium wankanglinii TaxID=2735136 RepID=A0A838CH14_9CORY|nr:hypothetical protein [Corynebacterium wankanglinii]MBA1834172.1 hypothetical protein [Corynebacterium wankanglinii]